MKSSIYILAASLLEVLWVYCLREVSLKKFRALKWKEILKSKQSFGKFFPFIGYVVFGIGNVIFLSLAIKIMSPAIAFAIWMSLSLIGMKLVGVFYFKEKINTLQIFFMIITLVGIIGLKMTETT